MICVEKRKTIRNTDRAKVSINEQYSFTSHDRISDIEDDWKVLTKDLSIFYSYNFLNAVEHSPPSGLQNRYLICYKNDALFGIISCQLKSFNGTESIKIKEKPGLFNKLSKGVKDGFASTLKFEGMVCGSVLLTGNYAYHFLDPTLDHKGSFLIAEEILEIYRQSLNEQGHNIKVTFLKDFYIQKNMLEHGINESNYKEFSVQPNMILTIRDNWKSYDNYLADFQSKYRVRAKRARKKFEGITARELDYVDIKKYNVQINQLYRNIVDKINFNLFFLHEDYFSELKKHLKEKFKLYAYFKGEKMVAFYTCIDNGQEMNAHFLGYEPEENRNHQLYLNSLYDMVQLALQYDFKTINFSRTAMEIKSSMGAEPHDMLCYLKHQNKLVNRVVAKIVHSLNPTEEWTQRRPFKS